MSHIRKFLSITLLLFLLCSCSFNNKTTLMEVETLVDSANNDVTIVDNSYKNNSVIYLEKQLDLNIGQPLLSRVVRYDLDKHTKNEIYVPDPEYKCIVSNSIMVNDDIFLLVFNIKRNFANIICLSEDKSVDITNITHIENLYDMGRLYHYDSGVIFRIKNSVYYYPKHFSKEKTLEPLVEKEDLKHLTVINNKAIYTHLFKNKLHIETISGEDNKITFDSKDNFAQPFGVSENIFIQNEQGEIFKLDFTNGKSFYIQTDVPILDVFKLTDTYSFYTTYLPHTTENLLYGAMSYDQKNNKFEYFSAKDLGYELLYPSYLDSEKLALKTTSYNAYKKPPIFIGEIEDFFELRR